VNICKFFIKYHHIAWPYFNVKVSVQMQKQKKMTIYQGKGSPFNKASLTYYVRKSSTNNKMLYMTRPSPRKG